MVTIRDLPTGYQQVANFIASDSSLFVYRRFGAVAARRLAFLQLELSKLERELRDLDETRNDSDNGDADEFEHEHKSLLTTIDQKLTVYCMVPPSSTSRLR